MCPSTSTAHAGIASAHRIANHNKRLRIAGLPGNNAQASRIAMPRRLAEVMATFSAGGASQRKTKSAAQVGQAAGRFFDVLPELREAGFAGFLATTFGFSMVPVQFGAPQRHAQIFFSRAVWGSSRVMP